VQDRRDIQRGATDIDDATVLAAVVFDHRVERRRLCLQAAYARSDAMDIAGIEQAHFVGAEAELAAADGVVDAQGYVAQRERSQAKQGARVTPVTAVAGGEAAQLPAGVGAAHEIQIEPVEQEFIPRRVAVQD